MLRNQWEMDKQISTLAHVHWWTHGSAPKHLSEQCASSLEDIITLCSRSIYKELSSLWCSVLWEDSTKIGHWLCTKWSPMINVTSWRPEKLPQCSEGGGSSVRFWKVGESYRTYRVWPMEGHHLGFKFYVVMRVGRIWGKHLTSHFFF